MAGQRCWEVMKCGKEQECPAYPDNGFACWNVPATVCRGQVQGGYSDKIGECRIRCEYYNGVMMGSIKQI
jgi:methyl-accepting chemotaxis protein